MAQAISCRRASWQPNVYRLLQRITPNLVETVNKAEGIYLHLFGLGRRAEFNGRLDEPIPNPRRRAQLQQEERDAAEALQGLWEAAREPETPPVPTPSQRPSSLRNEVKVGYVKILSKTF